MELFFEIHMMTLQMIETEDLTDEELRQLMAPTGTVLIEFGKFIFAAIGQRLSNWGMWKAQNTSA